MVEAKLVSIEELKHNNPTLCLSALRVFGRCHECEYYKRKRKENKPLKCIPVLKKQYEEILKRKEEVIKEYKEEIKKLDEMLK